MTDYNTKPTIENVFEKVNALTNEVALLRTDIKDGFTRLHYTIKAINKRWLDVAGEVEMAEDRLDKIEKHVGLGEERI